MWGYLYTVQINNRVVTANIFMASGPQFPDGGPTPASLLQFWWPEGRAAIPTEWHGEWSRNAHGPGTLWLCFNGYVPTGGLHGVFLHGSGQQYEGFDYRARRVRMELFSKWAVNQHDELEEILLPAGMR